MAKTVTSSAGCHAFRAATDDALGMDLEVDEREAPVGMFSLDLLARDGSGRPVIIENQLGTTDHTHLGQILTYAAGHNASVIVWIAVVDDLFKLTRFSALVDICRSRFSTGMRSRR